MTDNTIINPIIYLDTVTVNGVTYPGYPLGSIATSVLIRYGKNQPFPMAVVKVQKNFFNSLTYWQNVTDGAGQAVTAVPSITDGVTPIVIQAYGTSESMRVEKHETDGSYITLTCYTAAYKLKTTKIETIAAFTYSGSAFSFATASPATIASSSVRTRAASEDYRYVLTISVGTYTLYAQVSVDSANSVTTEYLFGTPASLFAFLAVCGAGYDASALLIDSGYAFTNAGSAITYSDAYTTAQLGTFKSSAHGTLPSDVSIVKLRGDAYCWAQIVALGYLTNCIPFFYDYAYFVDYNSVNSTEHYQSDASVTIDYGNVVDGEAVGGCAEQQYSTSGVVQDTVYHDLTYIAANADQGSTYVRSAQEVDAENYQLTYTVSDVTAKAEGDAVYFAYPCLDSQSFPGIGSTTVNRYTTLANLNAATGMFPGDIAYVSGTAKYYFYANSAWNALSDLNSPRNDACAVIGLNLLVRYYEPGDCVALQMCEVVGNAPTVTFPNSSYVFTSFDALLAYTASTPVSGDIAEVYEDGFTSYYKYNGTQWAFSDYGSDRVATFLPYTRVASFTDNQNTVTLTNAPLACTELTWPACETTLWFGMPEFMDASQQLSTLDGITQASSLTTTTDSDMSDKFAAKLVIGSQALSELDSTRSGFTGLIMEKNWNNDLYRLAGYNNGTVQAQFTSTGMISAGAGNVLLNASGIIVSGGNSSISLGGTTISSSGISINGGSIAIGSTVINSSGATLNSGTIGGNSFTSSGITITNGSLSVGNTHVNSSGTYINIGSAGSYSDINYAFAFSNGTSLSSSTCVGGLFGTTSSVFLMQGGTPNSSTAPAIILGSSNIDEYASHIQFHDRGYGISGYPLSFYSGGNTASSAGCMCVQCAVATVTANSDATITFGKVLLATPTPSIFFVPAHASSGSGGIGTDMHFKYFTSSSSGITGFVMRIPSNCTNVYWTAIGLLAA